MNTRTARLAKLLSQAEACLPIYLEQTRGLSHENKGIRRSEMFFLYASVAPLKPKRIVESGRARAQSTLVLSRLFPKASIVSLESDATSPDVKIAAERLRECEQCRLSLRRFAASSARAGRGRRRRFDRWTKRFSRVETRLFDSCAAAKPPGCLCARSLAGLSRAALCRSLSAVRTSER